MEGIGCPFLPNEEVVNKQAQDMGKSRGRSWKSLNQITSYAHLHAFFYLHAQIKTSQAKWAKIDKNTLTGEQLCFLVFACLNIHQNSFSFIAFEIRKKM